MSHSKGSKTCCCGGCHDRPVGPATGSGVYRLQLAQQYCCACVPQQICVSLVLGCNEGEKTSSALFDLDCGADTNAIHYSGEIAIADTTIDLTFAFRVDEVEEETECSFCLSSTALDLEGSCHVIGPEERAADFCLSFSHDGQPYIEWEADGSALCQSAATLLIRASAASNTAITNRLPCLDEQGNLVPDDSSIRDLCGGCSCICSCACIIVASPEGVSSQTACVSTESEPWQGCENGAIPPPERYAHWSAGGVTVSLVANDNPVDQWGFEYPAEATLEGAGVHWANPELATGDTPGDAATANLRQERSTNTLVLSNFGLNVDDEITGIVVQIEKSASVADAIYDKSVRLKVGGVLSDVPKANVCPWPTSANFVSYGNSRDDWGLPASALTAANLNSADFEVRIEATNPQTAVAEASIHRARVTVYLNTGTNCCELELNSTGITLVEQPANVAIGDYANRCPTPTATWYGVEDYTGMPVMFQFVCESCNGCRVPVEGCCSASIPRVLTVDISSSDCECAPVQFQLVRDDTFEAWIGTTTDWCENGEIELYLYCQPEGWEIAFFGGSCIVQSNSGVSGGCEPINLTATLELSGIGCCGPGHLTGIRTIVINITE